VDIKNYVTEKIDSYDVCCQCSFDIISNPRCVTWGGTFDRTCEDPIKLDRNIDLMLIGQNPWYNEKRHESKNIYGRAFGDKSEKILIDYLTQHNFNPANIWITNVVQCSVINNDPAFVQKAFENCKYFLIEEILLVNPKILVPMGKVAEKMLNKVLKSPKLGKLYVYNIYHPNALSYNPQLKQRYHEQFEDLKRMVSK